MKIYMKIPSADELVQRLGIGPDGDAQIFHTNNILRRMQKYMPMKTGVFSTAQTRAADSHTIETTAPQAWYLYYGRRMVNEATGRGPRYIKGVGWRWPKGAKLMATDDPLNYTTTFHPLAGPYWDRRLVAAEGDAIARELHNYIRFRSAK